MFSKKPGAMMISAECCRLTESDLDEIEDLAKANAAETYRGALLALVDEVRHLRKVIYSSGLTRCDEPGNNYKAERSR